MRSASTELAPRPVKATGREEKSSSFSGGSKGGRVEQCRPPRLIAAAARSTLTWACLRQPGTTALSPLACVLIAGLCEPIEEARRTAILDWTHVLADRLGVEHTAAALGQQHQT